MPDKLMDFIRGGGKGDYIDRAITAAGEGGSIADRLAALPKEIARGALRTILETRSSDPETQVKAITSLTGLLAGRAVAMDKPAPHNLVGMFVGQHAKTFNHEARAKAVGMAHDGATPEQIHAATGTHASAAMGGVTQEISDHTAGLASKGYAARPQEQNRGLRKVVGLRENFTPLSNVLRHPEVFKAYPQLAGVKVTRNRPEGVDPRATGSYNPITNVLYLKTGISREDMLSTVLHETQHVIQDAEKSLFSVASFKKRARNTEAFSDAFMKAASSGNNRSTRALAEIIRRSGLEQKHLDQFLNTVKAERQGGATIAQLEDLQKTADHVAVHTEYRTHPAETQARLTELRQNLTPEERRAHLPVAIDAETIDNKLTPKQALVAILKARDARPGARPARMER